MNTTPRTATEDDLEAAAKKVVEDALVGLGAAAKSRVIEWAVEKAFNGQRKIVWAIPKTTIVQKS